MFDCPEKETAVPNFKFVSKLTEFSSCQVCKKSLDGLSSISTKWPQCGTLQRISECSHEASLKLCILHKDNQLWLTPFRTEISKQLKPNSLGCNHESKCPQRGTLQKISECSHEASLKLCILHKDNQLWLTPFRTEILKLMQPNSLTPHNTIENIEDAIMNLQDITIKYENLLTQSHE